MWLFYNVCNFFRNYLGVLIKNPVCAKVVVVLISDYTGLKADCGKSCEKVIRATTYLQFNTERRNIDDISLPIFKDLSRQQI